MWYRTDFRVLISRPRINQWNLLITTNNPDSPPKALSKKNYNPQRNNCSWWNRNADNSRKKEKVF